ncbi:MAG: transporter [Flavobacteriales bacterium]|nr:transporter [Flavobacteriales bacterium]MBK7242002.1 transporter [Flavobacteriales bacterium]
MFKNSLSILAQCRGEVFPTADIVRDRENSTEQFKGCMRRTLMERPILFVRWITMACFVFLRASLSAQELQSDQPGFSEGASPVPQGIIQLEAGVQRDRFEGDSTNADLPIALLRIGILKGVELRLDGDRTLNAQQLEEYSWSVGTKIGLINNDEINLAVLGEYQFDDQGASGGRFAVLAVRDLTPNFELTMNAGALLEPGSDVPEFTITTSGQQQLSDAFSIFGEGHWRQPVENRGNITLDGGFLWLIIPNIQIDIAGGRELLEANWFLTAGITLRSKFW